jgi:hypothetical protein
MMPKSLFSVFLGVLLMLTLAPVQANGVQDAPPAESLPALIAEFQQARDDAVTIATGMRGAFAANEQRFQRAGGLYAATRKSFLGLQGWVRTALSSGKLPVSAATFEQAVRDTLAKKLLYNEMVRQSLRGQPTADGNGVMQALESIDMPSLLGAIAEGFVPAAQLFASFDRADAQRQLVVLDAIQWPAYAELPKGF